MVVPSAPLSLCAGLRAAMGGCISGVLGLPPARSPGGGLARPRRGMGGGAGTTSSELVSRSWLAEQPGLWPRLQGCTSGRASAAPRGDTVVGTPPTSFSMAPASAGPGDPTPCRSKIAGPKTPQRHVMMPVPSLRGFRSGGRSAQTASRAAAKACWRPPMRLRYGVVHGSHRSCDQRRRERRPPRGLSAGSCASLPSGAPYSGRGGAHHSPNVRLSPGTARSAASGWADEKVVRRAMLGRFWPLLQLANGSGG